MRLAVAVGAPLLLAGCASTPAQLSSQSAGGQCLAAVQLDGVLYVERSQKYIAANLLGGSIATVVAEYPCNDGGSRDPIPSTSPGEALGLGPNPGTTVYAVRGYPTSVRVAARWDDRMAIFERLADPPGDRQ